MATEFLSCISFPTGRACCSAILRDRLASQPIDWKPFNSAKIDQVLARGNSVLLVCKPNYHVGSEIAFATFNDKRIRRLAHENNFEAMLLEYNDWSGKEINQISIHLATQNIQWLFTSNQTGHRFDWKPVVPTIF